MQRATHFDRSVLLIEVWITNIEILLAKTTDSLKISHLLIFVVHSLVVKVIIFWNSLSLYLNIIEGRLTRKRVIVVLIRSYIFLRSIDDILVVLVGIVMEQHCSFKITKNNYTIKY